MSTASAKKFCQTPEPDIRAALLFGADRSAVAEAAQLLATSWTGTDLSSVTSLHEGNLDQLDSMLQAFSLFGESSPLVRIRLDGERGVPLILRALAAQEKGALIPAGHWLIEAGDLLPKSRLRKAFAAAASAVALAIEPDTAKDIQAMIGESCKNLLIEDDAIALAADLLAGNRALARAEIEKLSLYATDLGRKLTTSDVETLLMTMQGKNAGLAIDAALGGDIAKADKALQRFFDTGGSAISALRATYFRLLRLVAAHNGERWLRPPVGLAERPAFRLALSRWPVGRLVRAMAALCEAELNCKTIGQADAAIVRMVLLDIARRNV